MNGLLLLTLSAAGLCAGYIVYGRWLGRFFHLDDARPTPAHRRGDGVDFVPARMPVLLGHHFASIAGAAPIVGPTLAAAFGWLPVWLWILIGGVFLGAVHDFSSLVASIRHRGDTIGRLIERHIGRSGKLLFLSFSWLTLLLVIAVFDLLVAGSFVRVPETATSSLGFLLLAVAFGFALKRFGNRLGLLSVLGVALLVAILWAGQALPFDLARLFGGGEAGALKAVGVWRWALLGYVFVASVTPVHLLLQPRDYLNSFLLYAMMAGGLAGVIVARPALRIPAFAGWSAPELGHLFPILFVTVACGAISGFHSLVASGTTARQLARESDALPVGYGSMLIESLLAVLALVVVAATVPLADLRGLSAGAAIPRFAEGLAGFMARLGLPEGSGRSFVTLAVSAFALTSLDTATRIGRFVFEELAETLLPTRRWLRNRFVATAFTVAGGAALLFSQAGTAIWPLFGAANQLLATLTLLALSVWLTRLGRRSAFVRIPMVFMYLVTASALVLQTIVHLRQGRWPLAAIALLLLALAVVLAVEAWRALRTGASPPADPDDDGLPARATGPECPC